MITMSEESRQRATGRIYLPARLVTKPSPSRYDEVKGLSSTATLVMWAARVL